MATMQEAVRRLTIESTTRGVTQATDQLNQLGAAHAGVTVESQKTERATQTLERRLDSILRRVDQSYRAQQDLARIERDLNAIRARGLITLDRQNQIMDQARAGMTRTAAAARGSAAAIQNVGFQVGDFAVQIASGTNPMRAFIQQGTQLISMFGPWGAVIGAAGAVVGALATSFMDLGDSAKAAEEAADHFNAAIDAGNRVLKTRMELDAARRQQELKEAIDKTTVSLQEQQSAYDALAESNRLLSQFVDDPTSSAFVAGVGALSPEQAEGQRKLADTAKMLTTLQQQLADLNNPAKLFPQDGADAAEKAADALDKYNKEVMQIQDSWAKASESQRNSAQSLVDRLDPVAAATRKLEEDQGLLLVAMANGIEITGGYEAAMRNLEESYRDQIDPIGAFIRKTEELQKLADAKTFAEGFERDFKAIEQFGDQAFDRIGSAITEAFATGQLDLVKLGDIGKAVMSELIQFAIQLSVINPFKNWLTGGEAGLPTFGSIFKSIGLNSAIDDMILANPDIFAKGAAFSGGNVIPFARGGLVTAPTIFPMANGMGLMGEAGPEAVMPLQRTTDGRLGVAATGGDGGFERVIINNYTGEKASQEVRQSGNGKKDLIVTIGKAGADDIRSGGALARSLEQTYNLKRSGGGRG